MLTIALPDDVIAHRAIPIATQLAAAKLSTSCGRNEFPQQKLNCPPDTSFQKSELCNCSFSLNRDYLHLF